MIARTLRCKFGAPTSMSTAGHIIDRDRSEMTASFFYLSTQPDVRSIQILFYPTPRWLWTEKEINS